MQIPSGQIAPSPSTIQAFGASQRAGIAEAPERPGGTAAPHQQVARAEGPAQQRSAPPPGEPPRSLPRGSVVDLKV